LHQGLVHDPGTAPYEVLNAGRLALPSDLRLVERLAYVAERSVTGRAVLTEFRQAVANPGTPAPVLSVRDLWRVSSSPAAGRLRSGWETRRRSLGT